MKLRHQLFLISLLLLSLPWAGCQYLQAVDIALRDIQEASLLSNAESIAERLMAKPDLLSAPFINVEPRSLALYAAAFSAQPIMDGYKDDWRHYNAEPKQFEQGALSASLRTAHYKEQVYFFLEVKDDELNYFNPLQTQGLPADHLMLTLYPDEGKERTVYLYASTPGNMIVRYQDANGRLRRFNQVKGVLRESKDGYQVELAVDQSLLQAGFDIALIDFRHSAKTSMPFKSSMINSEGYNRLELVQVSEQLLSVLQLINPVATAAYILNADQFIIAKRQVTQQQKNKSETPWFIEWLYRNSLDVSAMPRRSDFYEDTFWSMPEQTTGDSMAVRSVWYQVEGQKPGSQAALSVVVPLFYEKKLNGFLLLEKTTDSLVALTNSAFNQLFLYTIGLFLLVSMGLLSYASWLSWRISRLNQVTNHAVTDHGLISINEKDWSALKAGDELGDLSRSYRQLLLKLRESQEYLRGLSSKLSHELRTPIAIVKSSLDNMAEVAEPSLQKQYNQRAQEGIERLNNILNAMSSANRIEESVLGAELTATPINQFLLSLVDVYQDIYPDHQIQFIDEAEPANIPLSQELFVQMLDKLVDNATDFSPVDEAIRIRLKTDEDFVVVQVENKGPLLPDAMQGRLFESMVSLRSDKGSHKGVHLGLGLYIARIIAELHRGQVLAQNDDGKGVIFSVRLPF